MFKFIHIFSFLFVIFIVMTSQASAEKVDPTRPFGHNPSSAVVLGEKEMVLESIIHGDGIHTVVISGQVLKTFDYIGEYQLTAVNDQSVILRSKTERIKLNVFKSNLVKTSVTN